MELNLAPQGKTDLIKEGTEATFMADVIEASREVPVIVDFWATWCGPCKSLGPVLEKAVTDARGKVRLVKIDVDQNQRIAAQLQVQSIPAVFAFVNGQPVDGFMGAQQPSQIKAFIDRLVQMSGGDAGLEEALAAAEEMLEEGALADAAQTFGAILGEEPDNVAALSGLARAYIAAGDLVKARDVLDLAPPEKAGDPRSPACGPRSSSPRPAPGRLPPRAASARPSKRTRTITRRATTSRSRSLPRATAPGRSIRCSSFSAATASGTRVRRRSSSSRSSTVSGRRASSPRRAAAAFPP